MLTKRIIPCLDIKNGRTVKGVNFINLRDAGDPVKLALAYSEAGADELVFLDISATHEGRQTLTTLVDQIARVINIPFTVGGGVSSVPDAARLLQAGADKIAVNSAAVRTPELINQLSERFGSQCVVAAVDARKEKEYWKVYISGGRVPTDKELFAWTRELQDRGAGEILFTSMDHDGSKQGYANAALGRMHEELEIPVIASGGAGTVQHFADAFTEGKADATLAASVFHFGEIPIPALKKQLNTLNIPIRL